MSDRLNVAVVFGGTSQEHDVAVVSAQQLMDAADPRRINVIPVYMDFENRFFSGASLRKVQTYRPKPSEMMPVRFGWGENGPELVAGGIAQPLDAVLPVCHGPFGEDGRLQGMLEMAGIPVTGFSAANSAIAMRKDATKALVAASGVNVLSHVLAGRSDAPDWITEQVGNRYPVVVKPCNLGSSIGVGIANGPEELGPLVEYVLGQDNLALIEPKVPNLVEYNIAVRWADGEVRYSAIERPKTSAELLDFKEKYLSSGGGAKGAFLPSEGMLSLTREINPNIPAEQEALIKDYAARAFRALGRRGAPRMDFMQDAATGEIWFNEINPIPGSYGFFLWEAAVEPLLYPELIDHLVEEARATTLKSFDDPVPQDAWLLPR